MAQRPVLLRTATATATTTATTATATATAAAVAAALVLGAAPAQAAEDSYVALGDSYSSGTGTRTYLSDGTSCQRSLAAYPALLARSQGLSLDFRACSGATTSDVARLQLGALGTATSYVSITVGGNDAGFSSVLSECALPAWASNCTGAIDKAVAIIDRTLPDRLASLFTAVRTRAPQATVVVAGYPRVFNGQDCNLATWFSATEMSRLNATADRLNTRLSAAATLAGLSFAGPAPAFTGHAVCDDSPWLNGLSNPVSESYHPNASGQALGYAPVVGARLTAAAPADPVGAASAAVDAPAAAEPAPEDQTQDRLEEQPTDEQLASELVARARPYAEQDRRVRPKPFRVPDLASAAVRAAARRAGVDLGSRASIDRADRLHAARQDAAAR